jgi:hypothetical protein
MADPRSPVFARPEVLRIPPDRDAGGFQDSLEPIDASSVLPDIADKRMSLSRRHNDSL